MDPALSHINPQEITGWISHMTNADYLRSVRDHCNERLDQISAPRERPPHLNREKATRPNPNPQPSTGMEAVTMRQVVLPPEVTGRATVEETEAESEEEAVERADDGE